MAAGRHQGLDGLRGVAALSVVFYHLACAYLPQLVPTQGVGVSWVAASPLALLYNGPYAVMVFFVLSGFVVANSADKRRRSVPVSVVLRYVRLGAPVIAAMLYGWALLRLFPGSVAHLKALNPHPWLLNVYDGDLPSLPRAFYEAAVGVYVGVQPWLDNPVWTIPLEFLGSVVIYMVYGLTRGRLRWALIAAFAAGCLLTGRPRMLGFAAGMGLSEARGQLPRWLGWPGLAAGLVAGALIQGAFVPHALFGGRLLLMPDVPSSLWALAGATGLVVATMTVPAVERALSSPPARFLGRLSFPLYLVHVPLLYTVFAVGYGRVSLWLIGPAFVITAIAVAWLFERFVDAPVVRLVGLRPRAAEAIAAP
jgi:peptidoglycan/LPS O-acetylase OafA/YrhL